MPSKRDDLDGRIDQFRDLIPFVVERTPPEQLRACLAPDIALIRDIAGTQLTYVDERLRVILREAGVVAVDVDTHLPGIGSGSE